MQSERGPTDVYRRRRLAAAAAMFAPLATLINSGCTQFSQMITQQTAPRVLPPAPSTTDIVTVINNNTNLVRSLYSADASLSAPMTPTLRATFALERPRRLRLRADTALTGAELDIGSNDNLFWLWAKRQQPPAILYCRHDQYAASAARQIFPVQPEWLVEAMGLPTIDPASSPQGPHSIDRGKLAIQTTSMGPLGPMNRTLVIDAARGWVLEQQLRDGTGQLVATCRHSNHVVDPASGATLPRHNEIHWPATQFQVSIDFRSLQVNTLLGAQPGLFELPQINGSPPVDMAAAGLNLGAPAQAQRPGNLWR